MTYSQFTLTFANDLSIGDEIVIRAGYDDIGITQAYREKWVNIRSQSNQVTLGTPTGIAGERSAINFVTAFNLDFNPGSFFEITRVENVVTVKLIFSPWDFYQPTTPDPNDPNGPYPALPDGVTLDIVNYSGTLFTIDSLTYSEATVNPPCTHFKVTIETSVLATEIQYPNLCAEFIENEDNPFSFEVVRGTSFTLACKAEDEQVATIVKQSYEVPQFLSISNFDINITPSPNGATITINNLVYTSVNNYEFSLDGETWQESNVFSGLESGDYDVYVRDQFGCSFNTEVSVSAFGSRLPYFLLPKSNSIRFANRITWGDCANYKNDDNTLSCESEVLKPFKHIILMQSCDIITTQFRSNYQENTATVIRENDDEVSVPVLQVTNNMGIEDKRDSRKYNLQNGKTGIYFISGNTYDYNTDVINGTYTLNGLLPEWGVVGNYVNLDGTWFIIEDIIFDETVNADVLVIENIYTGANVASISASQYNRENFEEYEFTIDFFDYLNENVRVRINSNDDLFTSLVQLSEEINTKIVQEDTLEIRYKNSTNTDLNFSRGLECKLRLPYTKIDGQVLDETENYKTDSTAILLSSEIYDLDRFIFEPLVKQIMRQLALALSHDTVTIRGVGYVKNDAVEVEGALAESNLYVVTAVMLRTGSVYNSNTGQANNIFAGENIEIPGLVEHESGYVKYN